jgi:hypothetical protein
VGLHVDGGFGLAVVHRNVAHGAVDPLGDGCRADAAARGRSKYAIACHRVSRAANICGVAVAAAVELVLTHASAGRLEVVDPLLPLREVEPPPPVEVPQDQ